MAGTQFWFRTDWSWDLEWIRSSVQTLCFCLSRGEVMGKLKADAVAQGVNGLAPLLLYQSAALGPPQGHHGC